jgi:hypothetical protein
MSMYDDTEQEQEQDGIQGLASELTDDDAPTDETPATESDETPEAAAKPVSTKTAVPDGHEAPVAFARRVDPNMKPQVMYGYVRGNPELKKILHDLGETAKPRFVIPINEGLEWWGSIQAKRAARAAATVTTTPVATPPEDVPVEA